MKAATPEATEVETTTIGALYWSQLRLLLAVRASLLMIGAAALAVVPSAWPAVCLFGVAAVVAVEVRRRRRQGGEDRSILVGEAGFSFAVLLLVFALPADPSLTVACLAESSAGAMVAGCVLSRRLAVHQVLGWGAVAALVIGVTAGAGAALQDQRWPSAGAVTGGATLGMVAIGTISERSSRRAGQDLALRIRELHDAQREALAQAGELREEVVQVTVGKERAERLVHDNLLDLYQRAAAAQLNAEDRSRFAELYLEARRLLEVDRTVGSTAAAVDELVVAGARLGLRLATHVNIEAVPKGEILRVITDVVGTLLGNVAKHAYVEEAVLSVRSDADELVVVLADRGVGFKPSMTGWSPFTDSLVRQPVSRTGGTARVQSAPGVGTQWRLRWAGTGWQDARREVAGVRKAGVSVDETESVTPENGPR